MANIDEMIALIKAASNPAEAKAGLLARTWASGIVATLLERADAERSRPEELPEEFGMHGQEYRLSSEQAQAVLNLQLHRLTGLEQDKIVSEYQGLLEQIDDYLDILSSTQRLMTVIREELNDIKEQFADDRRTEILQDHLNLSAEDLITEEDVVVTVSHEGYVKSQSLETYKIQRRGGRGKSATKTKDADFIDQIMVANTHDIILCFSSAGKVYWLKTYQLPSASRNSRGKPFVNLFNLDKNERINAILPVQEYTENQFIFMATAQGTVKKTPLSEFKRQRASRQNCD
jgi:DNA gyrase subunit A (EC 5.99.1.3)